jgi:hypothetical protein
MAMSYKRRGKTWLFTVDGVVSKMLLGNAVYRVACIVVQRDERGISINDRREGGEVSAACCVCCLLAAAAARGSLPLRVRASLDWQKGSSSSSSSSRQGGGRSTIKSSPYRPHASPSRLGWYRDVRLTVKYRGLIHGEIRRWVERDPQETRLALPRHGPPQHQSIEGFPFFDKLAEVADIGVMSDIPIRKSQRHITHLEILPRLISN